MKKTYTKPQISFESFLMSTSIAAGCEAKADTQANYNTCGKDFSGVTVFAVGYLGCNFQIEKDNEFNGVCYHVPSETNNVFNS